MTNEIIESARKLRAKLLHENATALRVIEALGAIIGDEDLKAEPDAAAGRKKPVEQVRCAVPASILAEANRQGTSPAKVLDGRILLRKSPGGGTSPRQAVLDYVCENGQTRSADLVAAGICEATKQAGKALWDLANSGLIRRHGDGVYGPPAGI